MRLKAAAPFSREEEKGTDVFFFPNFGEKP